MCSHTLLQPGRHHVLVFTAYTSYSSIYVIANLRVVVFVFFFFQAEDGIRDTSVTGVQTCALPIFYVERKVAAMLQQRLGPYLVGPRGLLQPLADIIKLMFKEELRPRAADPILFEIGRASCRERV